MPACSTGSRSAICTADPDMVVYAGRTQDLHKFIDSLSVRVCRNDPLTVAFSLTAPPLEGGGFQPS
ncbi:hypothetical protein GCM10009799_25550 [Nocardiopsis rhodophaea]|uniref:Uncharacterized protein n=1 Tax=Nocardiopsis rhodophaea TaxID=280238 RepID=A0ABN2T2M8_9ACTN